MEPQYNLQDICFINNMLRINIAKLFMPSNFLTEKDLKENIDLKIKEHKNKIVGDDGFSDSGHEDAAETLTELKKVLFCDKEELPLLLDCQFPNIIKWRLEIGK